MAARSAYTFFRTPLLVLGVGELVILYSSVYVGALFVYGSIGAGEVAVGSLLPRAVTVSIIMLASLVSMGLYDFHQRIYFHEMFVRVIVGVALGSLLLVAVSFVFPFIGATVKVGIVAVFYALILLFVIRFLFFRSVDENVFRHRTLVYGAGVRAGVIADLRRKADRRGFKIVGTIPAPGDEIELQHSGKLIRDVPIDVLANELNADEIVIAMDDRRGNLPIRELLNCRLAGINVIDLLEFLERETRKIRIDVINPGWLIFSPGFRSSRIWRVSKRVVDFTASAFLLLVTWPVMLSIALVIKLEDGLQSSVFYRQVRVGYGGEHFEVLKFRSMREDAESDGRAVWAKKNDDRITRVGMILRKYRLDELPQIFNVIRGQMSFVGPRPERPEFVEQLSQSIPYYPERHTVKPGITGWAQLRYPYGSSEEDALEKLQYDLYYVKNHNLLLDLLILLQTVEVVVWRKGAR